MARREVIAFRLSYEEARRLDEVRGELARAEFVRALVLAALQAETPTLPEK